MGRGRAPLRADTANRAAPPAATRTAIAQAARGGGVPSAGIPLVAAATRSSVAMPTAVPSCAAVLMIPDAPPRQCGATSVPRPVDATADSPMPAPPTAALSGTPHASAASGISAASETAIRARPAAIRRRATSRGGPGTTGLTHGLLTSTPDRGKLLRDHDVGVVLAAPKS